MQTGPDTSVSANRKIADDAEVHSIVLGLEAAQSHSHVWCLQQNATTCRPPFTAIYTCLNVSIARLVQGNDTLPKWAAQMLMSVLNPAQHHSRYSAFPYRSGQPSARCICLSKLPVHEYESRLVYGS